MLLRLTFAAALLTALPALAQEDGDARQTPRHIAALAAGHKALYTGSGRWSAGLTPEMIERDGMVGRGPDPALMKTMTAQINEARKIVTVAYAPDMPPRVAAWRQGLGCAQLPIGADIAAVAHLPKMPAGFSPPNLDAQTWPLGDANALATLPPAKAAALDKVVRAAFDENAYGGVTWGVIIVKDGKIVAERYERGYDMHKLQRTHSAAKSIASTLVGIATRQGLVDINVPGVLPEWRSPGDPRGLITVNHLLHMSSGLYTESSGNPQPELYLGGAAASERSVGNLFDSMPGKRWVYAGSDTILSVRAIRAALKDDARYLEYPYRELFWKIGMTRTFPETDWKGDYLMSGQAYANARDFARFGLLYMNDGVFNGERILPAGWAKYVATPAPAQPAGSWAGSNCAGPADCVGRGYGAQFWLFGPKQGLPEGSYTPAGARGQYAMIIPSEKVIVVRRGVDRTDGTGKPFAINRFSADVLKALATP